MNDESLIEAAATAYRERDAATGRIQPSPAWCDLTPDGREAVFRLQYDSRLLERALDADGLSTTVKAVLRRLS